MNKPLVMIDVNDIYIHANQIMKVKLTKENAITIYNNIDRMEWNCESSTFWSFIEEKINDFVKDRN